ncbi:MAG: HAMP domain-containing sensor histidine kinase [Trueperaceae bacterium]|nr:HAMP domain-containing sensor histidine kinase [Trueperaceae bacterium]
MSLRTRLTLTVLGVLTATVAAVLVVTDLAFAAQQRRETTALLERELARVAAVVQSGRIGGDLVAADGGDLRLQFVARDGTVRIPDSGATALPDAGAPTRVDALPGLDGRWLVASTPWELPSGTRAGTLRAAVSLQRADAARTELRILLVGVGAAALAVAAALAILALRRSLAPLADLARQARDLDPADPHLARYAGPDDEVGQVATALNAALADVRARRDAERERLADVAHELAAPLTVVSAHVDQLVARWDRADAAGGGAAADDVERLHAAQVAADDLMHVSQDLLTLARGDLGERIRWEVVDAAALAREMADAHPGLRLRLDDAADLRVVADAARLRQVLRNLLRNAERAAGGATGVTLAVGAEAPAPAGTDAPPSPDDAKEARVVLRVEDDGPGLTDAQAREIFERYHTRTGGTGLGLAVVQRLVQRMDGAVHAEPRPGGRGAAFVVALPAFDAAQGDAAHDAPDPDDRDPDAPTRGVPHTEGRGGGGAAPGPADPPTPIDEGDLGPPTS